jgi:hypothetical protein
MIGIEPGTIIRIKGCKRLCLKVEYMNFEGITITYKCGRVYKPSPKSRLRKNNFFRRKSIPLLLND